MTPPAPATNTPMPVNPRPWLRALVLAAIALVGGRWLTQTLDRESSHGYPGRLQARIFTVTAELPARLQEINVTPGKRVAAGDVLLALGEQPDAAALAELRQDVARREQEAQREKAAVELEIRWRRRELQAEMFQTQFKLAELRQQKLHLDVEQLAWHEQLSTSAVFSGTEQPTSLPRLLSQPSVESVSERRIRAMLQEDAAAVAAEALASQIALCEQRLDGLRALDLGLEAQVAKSHAVEQLELAARESAERLQELEEKPGLTTVCSPGYGIVGLFRKQTGDVVDAGEIMVQILDDDRRTIEVEIPSADVVRFSVGQSVRLEFPGKIARDGIISSISPQTSSPNGSLAEGRDAAVKLVISPAGKLWPPAPIGSRVLVSEGR